LERTVNILLKKKGAALAVRRPRYSRLYGLQTL
jgi:hypothetical protein